MMVKGALENIYLKNKQEKESGGAENQGSNLPKNGRREAKVWTSTALWWPWGT